ncbi:armadillo repeat-containing protein 10 isoform X2 [Python bivittatus]|uniref:Armadillo repeat-containing protein 10 isoform X2 n=1 Tax=Python bivittatus TaxID=176946 RepID=A0A9F5MQG0_PYTBI|nr:armadillo repeat-containing protein 10 isoform X2 [Python bivittatus]
MRESGGSALRRGLLGLAAAVTTAGAGYWLYRAASRRSSRASAGTRDLESRLGSLGGEAPERPGFSSKDQAPSGGGPQEKDLSKSPSGLEAYHIGNLLHILETTEDPLVQEQVLVTLSNSAAFSVNQDIIRYLGGLSLIGKMLSVPVTSVKEKALNALNNLSMNTKNQEEVKIYITEVCEEVDASFLNSELQLAGLRFLTNISVINDYHYMMTSFIPNFLNLLFEGNERTQVQVLKVLVNLSANPAMAEHLLNSQAPLLPSLLDSSVNKDILLRVLAFATNLTKSMKNEKSAIIHYQYSEGSIFSILSGNSLYTQKLASLLYHDDTEVKEQVAELITQQCQHSGQPQ